MRFPLSLTTRMIGYITKHKIARSVRFPLVLMLEPLPAVSPAYAGAATSHGSASLHSSQALLDTRPNNDRLSVEACLAAIDECNAPIVSICGGEPLTYPEIGRLVHATLQRKKHIYLCTDGARLAHTLHQFRPSSRLIFNIHLAGLRRTHDRHTHEGAFNEAIAGIKAAKRTGYLVCTNTTVFNDTSLAEIDSLFAYLTTIGVDGFLLSPHHVPDAASDPHPFKESNGASSGLAFPTRADVHAKFREARTLFKKYRMKSSPIYLDFLAGKRQLTCTAWANPTRDIHGWKGPCYLLTDRYHDSFADLMNNTSWQEYGPGQDPRCENCMVHCGYEPSAALGVNARLGDSLRKLLWHLS